MFLSEVNEAGLINDDSQHVITKCSWSNLDSVHRPVVKGLCDGAWHVKNAQLKPMHNTAKKFSPLQWSYDAVCR